MWWWHGSWGWWGWLGMTVGMVVFWGLLIWGVLTLIGYPGRGAERRSPEDVLADRFAHGEIDADEYRRRLDVLREDREPARGGA